MMDITDDSDRFYAQSHSDVNLEFVNRQKSVFDKLDAVMKEKEDSIGKHILKRNALNEDKKSHKRQRCDTRQFLGKESIFKRPEAPPPPRFIRNTPDYQRHPQKWTKYTLSDVSEEDMSDRSNTAAAMSFLQEIKAKKEMEEMEVVNIEKPIKFSKPSCHRPNMNIVKPNVQDVFEATSFRSSKIIMPEYVVGGKKNSKKVVRKSLEKQDKSKEVRLDHLEEEDEEV